MLFLWNTSQLEYFSWDKKRTMTGDIKRSEMEGEGRWLWARQPRQSEVVQVKARLGCWGGDAPTLMILFFS